MASLRVLIVDDETLATQRLVHLCARVGGVEVVGIAGDGWTALSRAEELRPDVLLLDISMPGLDGLALARRMVASARRPAIVFVTAHSRFAVEAFELAAADYLLKPTSLARLEQAFSRVAAGHSTAPAAPCPFLNEIWAPRGQEMVRIAIGAVDLVAAEQDYMRLHVGTATYLVRIAMTDLEGRLDPARFIRVHRSTLVPLDRIKALRTDAIEGWTLLLSTGHNVKVGRSFKSVVRKITSEIR